MRRLLLLLMLSPAAFGQTAAFPTAIASKKTIGVAKDQASAGLTAALDASSLTVYVSNGAAFAQYQILQIDSELTQVCSIAGNVLTLCTGSRGYYGTTATTHKVGRRVAGAVSAQYINALREEVQAIQAALGASLANIVQQTEVDEDATPSTVVKRDANGRIAADGYDIVSEDPSWDESLDHETAPDAPASAGLTKRYTLGGRLHTRAHGGADVGYAGISGDLVAGNCIQAADGETIEDSGAPCGTGSGDSGSDRAVKFAGYEVGAENAAAALVTADLTSHAFAVNNGTSRVLTEASCISDAGSQAVTVKIGSTTLFSITCRAPGDYSRSTTDGTTGYIIAASMTSTSVAAGAMLDLSGTANTTTKGIKLHIYGGYAVKVAGYEVGAENAAAALATADLTNHGFAINSASAKTLTEASCISDAGDQTVVVKVGATTKLTIHCVAPASYSRATVDGSTGYLDAAHITDTAIAAGAMLDLSGTANGTTKDVKLHIYGTVN